MAETNSLPDWPRGITFEQVWAALMEDREQLTETKRLMKENAEQLKETRRLIEENAERQKETDRIVRRNGKQMGDLHRKFGELAEHLVAPRIHARFNELNLTHYFLGKSAEGGQRQPKIIGRTLLRSPWPASYISTSYIVFI